MKIKGKGQKVLTELSKYQIVAFDYLKCPCKKIR